MKHLTDGFEACKSIAATNHRVAPNLWQGQVVVNESVALNLILSKITNVDFNNNDNVLISTMFKGVVKNDIMKSIDEKFDGAATSFQPIGSNNEVVKSFGSYRSMGLKLNYSCDCIVLERNDTYCCGVPKVGTILANGRACDVADAADVQSIALTVTLVPGDLSGAAGGVAVAAGIRENDVLTIMVRNYLFFCFCF